MKLKRWWLKNIALTLLLPSVLGCNPEVNAAYQSNNDRGIEVASKPSPGQRRNVTVPPKETPKNRRQTARSIGFSLPPKGAPGNRGNGAGTRLRFSLPPKGAPGHRGSAGTRDACTVDSKPPLTALVPGTNYGLTISERPTFWFYIPYEPNVKTPVKFELKNDQDQIVYQNTLQLTATPGIVGITLPSDARGLEVGKSYKWNLSFNCNPDNKLDITFVYGTVERVELPSTVKAQLDKAKGRDRLLFYAAQGWWYETLTELIEMRRKNPQDAQLAKDWQDLLKQAPAIQLDSLVNEPVVPCCQLKE